MVAKSLTPLEERDQAEELGRALIAAFKSAALYAPDHPGTRKQVERTYDGLRRVARDRERALVRFVQGNLIVGRYPIMDDKSFYATLADRLAERGIGGMVFMKGFTLDDVLKLAGVTAMGPVALQGVGGPSKALEMAGVTRIRIISPKQAIGMTEDGLGEDPQAVYVDTVREVSAAVRTARHDVTLNIEGLGPIVERLLNVEVYDPYPLLLLTATKRYDDYLAYHMVNTAVLALALGGLQAVAESELREVAFGYLLFDIGMARLPREMLEKPRALGPAERQVMVRHPEVALALLQRSPGIPARALKVIEEHHLGLGLTGYPERLHGAAPDRLSSNLRAADMYDALTSVRPFRNARLPSQALASLDRLGGTELPRETVTALGQLLGDPPIGSTVRLDSGELALISRPSGDDGTGARVILLARPSGEPYRQRLEVRLEDPPIQRTIVAVANPISQAIGVDSFIWWREGEAELGRPGLGGPRRFDG